MHTILFKPGMCQHGFLKLFLCRHLYVYACACVCVCVCVSPPLSILITSGMVWHDITPPYDWLNKFYRLYVAAVAGIIGRYGLTIEVHHWNQLNKSKLALCKPGIHFYSHLKQLYISNKMGLLSYKGRCGIGGRTHMEMLKKELTWATGKVISSLKQLAIPQRN